MSAIPNLSNLSNISRLGSVRRPNKKAYLFDGSNDYIAGDTTIGRTGYDMNVSGNVSTGSDADGSYFWINGNRDATTGTKANFLSATPTFTQATSFTIKARVKIKSFPVANVSGIFGADVDCAIDLNTTQVRFTVRGSSTVTNSYSASLDTLYDYYLVYDSTVAKFYVYINGTLQNVGGTSGPATFSTNNWYLGDDGTGSGTAQSCNKYIYHAAIRNVALTQAEIDADIALGNTTKTDSRIVAYYIPENLQYNTQYMTNPKSLDNAAWSKLTGASVVADTTVAPDGTTTADSVTFTADALSRVEQTNTSITGSTIASKTFIVKAFVKVAAGTANFRLKIAHAGVANYNSSNLTATTDWQEFTFTQTFTSSTSGTGVLGGVQNESTGTSTATIQVRNVRVFLTNETLRDESPNIGGYIGWKTNKVFSCWCKPNADGVDTAASQGLIGLGRAYAYIRASTNGIRIRYGDRIGARESSYTLGSGFRNRVHFVGVVFWNGSVWATKVYINGVLQDSDTRTVDAPNYNSSLSTVLRAGRVSTTYYSGYIRDPRIYTFTGSFTDADALAIYNGLEPSSAGITKYLHWRPTPGETGTTAIDHSGNSRTGTLTGGVTRPFLSGS